jgi:site-specific recombinase XerD
MVIYRELSNLLLIVDKDNITRATNLSQHWLLLLIYGKIMCHIEMNKRVESVRKTLVHKCQYATNPITGIPLFCDVYVLLDSNEKMLVHENMFLADIAKNSSLETVRASANDLLSFAKMSNSMGGWSSVTQQVLTGYLHGELFQKRRYKRTTMQRHIATLKKFFEWVNKKGYSDSPKDFDWGYEHLYSRNPSDAVAYNASQHSFHSLYISKKVFFDELLPNVNSNDPFLRKRDQIVLRLGYECGTRAHEALLLDAKSVRQAIAKAREANDNLWATATVPVKGKGAKNRDLLLPPELCEFIWDFLVRYRGRINECKGPLICKNDGLPLKDPKHASTVFRSAYRCAGKTRQHRQGYHRLRKSFGTNLCQECFDTGKDPWVMLPRRLGHSDINTTKLYIQFDALRNNRSSVLRDLRMRDSKFSAIHGV